MVMTSWIEGTPAANPVTFPDMKGLVDYGQFETLQFIVWCVSVRLTTVRLSVSSTRLLLTDLRRIGDVAAHSKVTRGTSKWDGTSTVAVASKRESLHLDGTLITKVPTLSRSFSLALSILPLLYCSFARSRSSCPLLMDSTTKSVDGHGIGR